MRQQEQPVRAMEADELFHILQLVSGGNAFMSVSAAVHEAVRMHGRVVVERVSGTVVYKMAFPWAALLPGLAEGGPHQIAPIESDGKFNPKQTIRGSGRSTWSS